MYNGIGIGTARGTGTNGYVQKNLSFVPTKRERVEYVKDADLKRLEKLIEKKGDAEILEHQKKRQIEVKCMEVRDMLINNGYDEEVTNEKVQKFRKMLIEREGLYDKTEIEYDVYGRPVAKETHQIAQANDEKNRKLREAFGLAEYDQKAIAKQKAEEAKAEEQRKAELVRKQYTIVQDDEPEEIEAPKPEKEKKKDKEERHRHKSRDEKKRKSSPEKTKERSTHKHSKKHRRERSSDDEEESRHRRRRERSP